VGAAVKARGPVPRDTIVRPALGDAMSTQRRPCSIELSDNTNLFGTPPAAARAASEAVPFVASRYPTPRANDLRDVLATMHGVPPSCVVIGCGSDGVLEGALRTFTSPGDRFAFHAPTFSMVAVLADNHALEAIAVECDEAPSVATIDRMFDGEPRVLYLCSPNNPTGARTDPEVFAAVRRRLRESEMPPLVILDQAYAEFDEGDAPQRWFTHEEPVLVVRTLSKAYGLAGMRVGYGIAPALYAVSIAWACGPYAIGTVAERAAIAALTEDRAWVRARIGDVVRIRRQFTDALRERGFRPLRSAANFVLVPVADSERAVATLGAHGICVRAFQHLAYIGDAIRITIGPWPMLERCLEALAEVQP